MKNRSLTRRVILLSSAWTALAIGFLGWLLLAQFQASAERNFEDLQKTQLFSLIGAVEIAEDGTLTGAPNLGDARFLNPGSGWFWRVSPLSDLEQKLNSISLGDFQPMPPSVSDVPFDEQFSRSYFLDLPGGDEIRVLETEIDLGSDAVALFQVAGNQTEFETGIRDLALQIATLLMIFGFGVVAINGLILLLGLKPLDRIRRALSDIRLGRTDQLVGDFPNEIEPMVTEMNVLIQNNRQTLETARTQVGNLAHSLKTPIAVLANEATLKKQVSADIVRNQAASMERQVQHYLSKARIAAQAGSISYNTDASAAAHKLVRVMQKLNPDKSIEFQSDSKVHRFAGEQEDFDEILGNLIENACKWSKQAVRVSVETQIVADQKTELHVVVEDDGPGISQEDRNNALERGKRLDETVPGTGLGLAIVGETVVAYGGKITLGESPLGGLKVFIALPGAQMKR